MLDFDRHLWYSAVIREKTVSARRKCPMLIGRKVIRTTILVVFVAAVLLLVGGCGPGEPFEIEGLFTP